MAGRVVKRPTSMAQKAGAKKPDRMDVATDLRDIVPDPPLPVVKTIEYSMTVSNKSTKVGEFWVKLGAQVEVPEGGDPDAALVVLTDWVVTSIGQQVEAITNGT